MGGGGGRGGGGGVIGPLSNPLFFLTHVKHYCTEIANKCFETPRDILMKGFYIGQIVFY